MSQNPNNNILHQSSINQMIPFERQYQAFSPSYMSVKNASSLEESDKLILPPSALQDIISNNVAFPVIFELSFNNQRTHCGVLEFNAADGLCYIPEWIMHQLNIGNGNRVLLKHKSLPNGNKISLKSLQSNISSIENEELYLQHIQNKLNKLTTISIGNIINVKVNNKQYKMEVNDVTPSLFNAILVPDDGKLQFDLINNNKNKQKNENDAANDVPPIQSNIVSTKGNLNDDGKKKEINQKNEQNNNHLSSLSHTKKYKNQPNDDNDNDVHEDEDMINNVDTLGGGNNDDDEDEDDEQNLLSPIEHDWDFEEDENEDDGGWDENGLGDDMDNILQDPDDGQVYIPVHNRSFKPKKEEESDEEEVDPNSTAEGPKSRKMRPKPADPKVKSWVCEQCNAINNLHKSMERDFKCICCPGRYRPGQDLIVSKAEDKPTPKPDAINVPVFGDDNEQIYTIWICNKCSWQNDPNWINCGMCAINKPDEGIKIGYTAKKPILLINTDELYDGKNWFCSFCKIENTSVSVQCIACSQPKHQGINPNYHIPDPINYNQNNNRAVNRYQNNNRAVDRYEYDDKRRRIFQGRLHIVGVERDKREYPVFGAKNVEPRLIKIFGRPYRNKYILENSVFTEWSKDYAISHHFISKRDANGKLGFDLIKTWKTDFSDIPWNRGMAMNDKTGWIAYCSNVGIWLMKPNGAGSYQYVTHYLYENILIKGGQFLECKIIDESSGRIRFVDNNIYVFKYSTNNILHFQLDGNLITYVQTIYDAYFKETDIKDIYVTNKLLLILFDRWIGVYKLYPFEWYHAIAFSKKSIDSFSFEMITYEDQENKEDEKEEFIDDNGEYAVIPIHKNSFKNYIFVNCTNNLIAVHPTNPTYDYMHVADNTCNIKVKYCMSKKYGVFYISNERDRIIQSSQLENKKTTIIELDTKKKFKYLDSMKPLDIKYDNKIFNENIKEFNNIFYDESYGISGRLLVSCKTNISYIKNKDDDDNDNDYKHPLDDKVPNSYDLMHFFNNTELKPLRDELSLKGDYFLMPGTNKKPFNLIVFVFEMLYGSDVIDILIQSPDFNPAYKEIEFDGNIGNELNDKEEANGIIGIGDGDKKENKKEDKILMMDMIGEGDLAESFVAIQPQKDLKPNDNQKVNEDEVDMEIENEENEEEGV